MLERNPRWSRMLAAGIAAEVVSLIGLMPAASRLRAAEAVDPAAPVVMEIDAVTLELVCRDGATEGEFHPLHARMLEAATWGGNQQCHADLTGYAGQPWRPKKGKTGQSPQGECGGTATGRPDSACHAQACRRNVGGRCGPGDRHVGGQGRYPLARHQFRHAQELPRRQDRRPAIARGNPFRHVA